MKRRILLVAEAVTFAHVARLYVLAKWALELGHGVHFATDFSRFNNSLFDFSGMTLHEINSVDPEKFMASLNSRHSAYNIAELQRSLDEDVELLWKVVPDLVIGDFRLTLPIAAKKARNGGIRCATVIDPYWSSLCPTDLPVPNKVVRLVRKERLAQRLFNKNRRWVLRGHIDPMNELRRKFCPNEVQSLREVYCQGDHILYAGSPLLVPIADKPPSHHWLGPVTWEPKNSLPEWWDDLPADKPIVYVTMGSSGDIQLYPAIIKALGNMDVSVMMATSGRFDPGDLPENVFSVDYLPGSQAASRADLMISNGGSPSTYQALLAGTPVLGIPDNMDQLLNMRTLVDRNLGYMLRPHKASPRRISKAVSMLLDLDIKSVSDMISSWDTRSEFEKFISEVL